MQELKDRIVKDGEIYPGDILKVSSFLNHQLDTELLDHIGKKIADKKKLDDALEAEIKAAIAEFKETVTYKVSG